MERGGTWPSRRSDISAVPRGRFAFMPRGGDYPGLRGQERRRRFDLRAEAEPPLPSARVTHRGCGWEVDPERGLNQATGLGAGVCAGGAKQAECGWGDAGNAPGQGVEAPGQLAGAPRLRPLPTPLPPAHRIPSPTGSAASSRHGDRWRGVTKAPPLGRPRKSAEGCTQVAVRVLFWLPRGRVRARSLPPALGEKRAGAARGGLWNAPGDHLLPGRARLPGSQIPPLSRTFELLLDSFSPFPAGLATPSLSATFSLLCPTIHTDQVSDSGGRTKEEENPVFSTGWEKIPGSQKVQTRQGGRSKRCGVDSAPSPSLLSAWCQPAPSPNHHTGREPRRVRGPGKPPSSPTTPAALKFDPKEFRIRFQNTAEPSRTNTPQLPRPRREPQRAG